MKLIHEIPGAEGNRRIYLELSDKRKLPLPYPWRNEEFLLLGNLEQHCNGKIIGLYDRTTRTGSVYKGLTPTSHWLSFQPGLREDFFSRILPTYVRQAETKL